MIKRINHVGISVASLQRSVEFYCRALGMAEVERAVFEGKQYEQILALPGTRGTLAIVRGGGLTLELFQFTHPPPRPSDPTRPVCDHGITHFCIEVDRIERVCEQMERAGARLHCPPTVFFGTTKATYVRDPDGNVIELVEAIGD